MTPTVTVGIPFYNNANSLLDAVRSVFAQTIDDWELILVDDGSSDSSLALVRQIHDPRVSVVSDGRNLGLPARLNQIARMAQGLYLARMDADDRMHPDRLGQQVEFFRTHPEFDLVGTGVYSINSRSQIKGVRLEPEYPWQWEFMLTRSPFSHPTVMARTEWFQSNPYDETFLRAQDQELWLRTFSKTRATNLQEPLLFLLENGSMSPQKYAQSVRLSRLLIRRYGRGLIGSARSSRLIMLTYLKDIAYRSFHTFGMTDRFLNHRNSPLSMKRRIDAEVALARIAATPIPSLPLEDREAGT